MSLLLSSAVGLYAATSDPSVQFRAEGFPTPSSTSIAATATRAVVKTFQDQYPHYQIEPFAIPSVQGTASDSATLRAIAAGMPPHAIYVNFRISSTYISQGFLDPIEILLARVLSPNQRVRQTDDHDRWLQDPSPEEIAQAIDLVRQRVPRPVWPVVYRTDDTGNDPTKHIWAVPTSSLVIALMYRKDLFAQAGLDPDRAPATWDEYLAVARQLTNPQRQVYGTTYSPGMGASHAAYTWLVSMGARAVEQDDQGRWHAAFATDGAAQAIYFLWQLVKGSFERDGKIIRGAAYPAQGDGELRWERGQIGMRFGYLDEELLSGINPQLVGIAPVPLAPNGQRGSEINCRMLGVFSGSTPAQKLAIMRYIWFNTSQEAQRIRTDVYVQGGYGRFVNPQLLEQFGYQRLLKQVPAQWRDAFDTAMENGVPEPYGRNTQNIYRWLSQPINLAMEMPLDQMPREEALLQIRRLLDQTAREVDVKVLGSIPPQEMRQRRVIAVVVISLIAAVFAWGTLHVWRYFTRVAAPMTGRRSWRRYAWGYLLLLPGLGLVAMWQYFPLVFGGLSMSFMDYQIVRDSTWVGVDNFANVLFDDKFWYPLGRTFLFLALTIGLGFWPPILLAILLQEVPTATAKYVYRTIFYLPAIISGVVVMFLWKQLYSPTESGVLNQILLSLNWLDPISATVVKAVLLGAWLALVGVLLYLPVKIDEMDRGLKLGLWAAGLAFTALTLWPVAQAVSADGWAGIGAVFGQLVGRFDLQPLRWVEDPALAMLCVVIPTVWAGSGPGCILYLAALKSVPDELYEAADIDGAGAWHKVFYIVVPFLKYLITIQFVAAVVGAFKGGTDFILAMTGGGPNGATNILALEIFIRTFMDLQFGVGTAMAWLLGALLIGFTAFQLKMLSRAEFRTAAGRG